MIKATCRMIRVSARLAKDDAKKLAYLSRSERRSVSDIIRTAIRRYYNDTRSAGTVKARNLYDTGFIGCGESDGDLSVTYKRHLTGYLLRKHGFR